MLFTLFNELGLLPLVKIEYRAGVYLIYLMFRYKLLVRYWFVIHSRAKGKGIY